MLQVTKNDTLSQVFFPASSHCKLKFTSVTKQELLKMCHLRHTLQFFLWFYFCIFNHPLIYQIYDIEYWYLRQGAFLNISFEPQLIK